MNTDVIVLVVPDSWWTSGIWGMVSYLDQRRCIRLNNYSTVCFYFKDTVWPQIHAYGGRIVFAKIENGEVVSTDPQENTSTFNFKPHVAFDDEEKAALFRLTYL